METKFSRLLDNSIILKAAKNCMDIYKLHETNYSIDELSEYIIICIRGTANLSDWTTNIKFLLRNKDTHRGFKINAQNILTKLIMKNFLFTSTKKLIITGHSLGGSTALVLADILICRILGKSDEIILITFGSPRPGGRRLKRRLKNVQHFRFVHGDDIVPLSPPYLLGYTHTHSMLYLEDMNPTPFDHIQDHHIENYYKSLVALTNYSEFSFEQKRSTM